MSSQPHWLQPGFGDVEAAHADRGSVEVHFANGDVVHVEAGRLGVVGDFEAKPAAGGAAVLVSTATGQREIDWMVLRAATDAAFAQQLRERDAGEAKRVGRRLRALRENREMSQRDVAGMLGMSPPQLAKLEQGDTDMRISTLRSLLRALGATFADISGPDAPELSTKEIAKRAQKVGVPAAVVKRIAAAVDPREMLDVVSRGFGWHPADVLSGALAVPAPAGAVKLKGAGEPSDQRDALLALAESLARRSALAYRGNPGSVPADPEQLRREVLADGSLMTLDALVDWCWRAGILVAPMEAPGGFAACVWRIGDQPVVVLKEAPDYKARWLFALAHELGHIAHNHIDDGAVVDEDLRSKAQADQDQQEREANAYALELLVPGHAEILEEIRSRSQIEPDLNFKPAAINAAKVRNLNVPLVLVVAAFGLPDVARSDSRWGSANNEAKPEGSARAVVAQAYGRNLDLNSLDRPDAQLVKAVALG